MYLSLSRVIPAFAKSNRRYQQQHCDSLELAGQTLSSCLTNAPSGDDIGYARYGP